MLFRCMFIGTFTSTVCIVFEEFGTCTGTLFFATRVVFQRDKLPSVTTMGYSYSHILIFVKRASFNTRVSVFNLSLALLKFDKIRQTIAIDRNHLWQRLADNIMARIKTIAYNERKICLVRWKNVRLKPGLKTPTNMPYIEKYLEMF